VTSGLIRYYGTRNLHIITGSCYKRRPELGSPLRRDLFLKILEQARRKYQFVVYGYVVMPEHFHLLTTEPEKGDPSIVMKSDQATVYSAGEPRTSWRSFCTTIQARDDTDLAPAVLRFQCVERTQARGKAEVYPSQSREARTGSPTGRLDVE
jgi:REP element-mobilizing transposase RayT